MTKKLYEAYYRAAAAARSECAFITPAMLANESKGWYVITDPKQVRAGRKYFKKMERQIRNAQRDGQVIRRIPHRYASHGRRRILAWREASLQ